MICELTKAFPFRTSGFELFSTKKNKSIKVVFIDENATRKWIVKVARNDDQSALLERENAIVSLLSQTRHNGINVCNPIFYADICGTRAFGTEYIHGNNLAAGKNKEKILSFLEKYVAFVRTVPGSSDVDFSESLSSVFHDFQVSTFWRPDLVSVTLEMLEFVRSMETGFTHNDLIPSNIICANNEFYLIDFEMAETSGPILKDLFWMVFHLDWGYDEKLALLWKFGESLVTDGRLSEGILYATRYWFAIDCLLREGDTMDQHLKRKLLRVCQETTLDTL